MQTLAKEVSAFVLSPAVITDYPLTSLLRPLLIRSAIFFPNTPHIIEALLKTLPTV